MRQRASETQPIEQIGELFEAAEVVGVDIDADAAARLGGAAQRRLAALDIPAQVLRTDMALRAALTYRRRRKVIRTTPTGGAYTVEIEEEVG